MWLISGLMFLKDNNIKYLGFPVRERSFLGRTAFKSGKYISAMPSPGNHSQKFTTWHLDSTTRYSLIKSASFNRSIDLLLGAAVITPMLLFKVVKGSQER